MKTDISENGKDKKVKLLMYTNTVSIESETVSHSVVSNSS